MSIASNIKQGWARITGMHKIARANAWEKELDNMNIVGEITNIDRDDVIKQMHQTIKTQNALVDVLQKTNADNECTISNLRCEVDDLKEYIKKMRTVSNETDYDAKMTGIRL